MWSRIKTNPPKIYYSWWWVWSWMVASLWMLQDKSEHILMSSPRRLRWCFKASRDTGHSAIIYWMMCSDVCDIDNSLIAILVILAYHCVVVVVSTYNDCDLSQE